MGKSVFIAEKPSVAEAFADALKVVDKQKRRATWKMIPILSPGVWVTWLPCHIRMPMMRT